MPRSARIDIPRLLRSSAAVLFWASPIPVLALSGYWTGGEAAGKDLQGELALAAGQPSPAQEPHAHAGGSQSALPAGEMPMGCAGCAAADGLEAERDGEPRDGEPRDGDRAPLLAAECRGHGPAGLRAREARPDRGGAEGHGSGPGPVLPAALQRSVAAEGDPASLFWNRAASTALRGKTPATRLARGPPPGA